MTESPIKQCLILLIGMVFFALALSKIMASSGIRPASSTDQNTTTSSEQAEMMECYIEVYSSADVRHFSLKLKDRVIIPPMTLSAHTPLEIDIELPTHLIELNEFFLSGEASTAEAQKIAISTTLEAGNLDETSKTTWVTGGFEHVISLSQ